MYMVIINYKRILKNCVFVENILFLHGVWVLNDGSAPFPPFTDLFSKSRSSSPLKYKILIASTALTTENKRNATEWGCPQGKWTMCVYKSMRARFTYEKF